MGFPPALWGKGEGRKRLVMLLAAGAAMALCASGCGSSGDSTSAAQQAPRLTKAQFVKKTNDICFANSQAQAEEVEGYKEKHHISAAVPPVAVQEKMIVEVILPFVHKTVGELEELGEEARPPRNEAATLEEFVGALKKATAISEKTPRWLAEPSKADEPFMEARELAGKMGTYLCGQA